MTDSRRCAVCESPIAANAHGNTKYCSSKCVDVAHVSSDAHAAYLTKKRKQTKARWTDHTCPICEAVFIGPGNKLYCSKQCLMVASSRMARERNPEHCRERSRERDRRQRVNPSVPQTCTGCGVEFMASRNRNRDRFCTSVCRYAHLGRQRSGQAAAQRDRTLLTAWRNGDHQTVISKIKSRCEIDAYGCWIWTGRRDSGNYPAINLDGKNKGVHRIILEAKFGQSLGSQVAHHMCAITACCNPDHLEPATHAENILEMMQRQAYLARIRELEAALTALAPNHPLLDLIPCR